MAWKPKPKRTIEESIGLTPKSGFLDWLRGETLSNGPVSDATHTRQISKFRDQVFHRFGDKMAAAQALSHDRVDKAALACTTRSSNTVVEDCWTIDMDAPACDVTDVR